MRTLLGSSTLVGSTLLGMGSALVSKDGVTGKLPALGWNSWNEYGCDINEEVFVKVAKLFVSTGLKDLGYEYVNIDDCWSDQTLQRDNKTKEILPDFDKFPKGIKHTAEKIHDLGLKLGIYSDAGTLTCGGYVGSLGHEEIDAATFAKWGIDYLKYDNCDVPEKWDDKFTWFPEYWQGNGGKENQTRPAPPGYDWSESKTATRFNIMRDALEAQDHIIQYSLCVWGHAHADRWSNQTGHSWRMWGDIYPEWIGQYDYSWGLMPILNHASFFTNTTNFWGHGDYDMLEVGNGNLTLQESRSHFALWAALKSPLIIGTTLDDIKPEILSIFKTEELVAFNQDPVYGASAYPYKWGINPDFTWNQTHPAEYWVGPSSRGVHVFILNTLDTATEKAAVFGEIPGLKASKKYKVHDMWTGADLGVVEKEFKMEVEPHDTLALRFNEVNGASSSRPHDEL